MSIKNETLEDFFSKSKNTNFSYKNKNLANTTEKNQEKVLYKKFRVFDDPTRENENINELSIKKTEDKLGTNWGQTEDKINIKRTNRGQTEDKLETEPRTNSRTNWGQTEDKPRTKCTFSSLVGLQRKIIFLIHESTRISINGITQPMSLQHVADRCKTTEISAKKTIQRLEKMGAILRVEFKVGRGGWTRYSLPENILQEIIRYETEDKLRTN